jgi:hypothetical protein
MNQKKSVKRFNLADYEELHVFQLAQPAINNSLTTKEGQPVLFPPTVTISAVDRVTLEDEEGNYEENIIAYRPGYSSIFVNEGEDMQALLENKNRSLGDIEFINGYLRVSSRQVQLLEFLRLCNKNGTNKNRDKNTTVTFFEVNHDEAIKSIMDNEERDIEIITFCSKGDWDVVKSVARSMGINVNQSVAQVRYDLRMFAMRDESSKSTFLRGLKNPSLKRKAIVLDAIENEIVFHNRVNNTLSWANGNNITTAPIGKDAVEYFVDNSFNNSYGESTYAEIERELNEFKNPSTPIEGNDDLADTMAFKEDPIGTIIRLGKVVGLLEVKGGYIKFGERNYRKSDFVKMLEEDNELFADLKQKLLPKQALV